MRACAAVVSTLLVGAVGLDKFVAVKQLRTLLEKVREDPADDDAMAAFQSALYTLANKMQPIKEMVEAAHTDTQQEITTRVGSVESSANTAQTQKQAADVADAAYHSCIAQEKQDRIDVETKQTEYDDAVAAEVQPCAEMEEAKHFSTSITLEAFTCDIEAQGGNCDTNVYDSESKGQLSSAKSTLGIKSKEYLGKKNLCEAARAAIETADTNLGHAQDKWSEQRQTCKERFGDREVALCNFGAKLQVKCERVDEYSQLMRDIAGSGTEWSHSDREGEYAALQITECLVSAIGNHQNADMFADSLAACEHTVVSIGELDRKYELFTSYVSNPYYPCPQEESINVVFNEGSYWEIPPAAEAAPSSGEYVEISGHVETLMPRDSFSFCSSSLPGK